MFFLKKKKVPNVLEISFDYWECLDPMGPFQDILNGYAAESGIAPKQIQLVYQYLFVEDDRKLNFYWNAVSRIYIFYISSAQYQMVYDRLERICGDLNRRINERKRLEKLNELPPPRNRYSDKNDDRIFKLYSPKENNVLEIVFVDWESISGLGPFYDVLESYAKETGIIPKTVKNFYNYMFVEDGYNIQFYWNAVASIYVFYIAPEQYQIIYNRIKKICGDLNRRIREKKRLERLKMFNREPPPFYHGRHG